MAFSEEYLKPMPLTANPGARPRFSKIDGRLVGTWKSDKRRTLEHWVWSKKITPKIRARAKSYFGALEITYTRNRVILKLPQRWEQSFSYLTLGADDKSVAIICYGKKQTKIRRQHLAGDLKFDHEFREPEIQHIHFGEGYYWISVGDGRNREFFRKVQNKE